jgi:pyruvate kinase
MILNYPNKKTDIICTIGPASWDEKVMEQLIANGMNVARVNAAFADTQELEKVENLVRKFSSDVKLMLDVKGPEVRLNKFANPIILTKDLELEIGSNESFLIFPANYPNLYQKINIGQDILVGDGDVRLTVTQITDNSFIVKVIYGEKLKPGKALNFPGVRLTDEPLTSKDIELIDFIIDRDWEYVSASFIGTKEDAIYINNKLAGSNLKLIAKIEDVSGITNIDEILEVIDGVMIARGGLGVDIGFKYVGLLTRYLLEKCIAVNKYVITATQILESMTTNPVPTRAEANDILTAIMLGSSAVMLSGESSIGEYPVETVKFMSEMDALCQELVVDGKPDWQKMIAKINP